MRTTVLIRDRATGKAEKSETWEGEAIIEVYVTRDQQEPRLLAKLEVTP